MRAFWDNNGGLPAHLNLADNYWGTDDPAQISEWIDDYNDYDPRENGFSWVIVDYEPFSPVELQTESMTWGAVKALFR